MALVYDFDIFEVIPEFGSPDPKLDAFLADIGFGPGRSATTVALFRDPRTADALRKAPTGLRNYFLDSGFGLNTYASGAPSGRYPARDEAARLDLIRRLTENAPAYSLPRPDDCAESGDIFRLGEFLAELDRSEPIVMPKERSHPGAKDRTLPMLFETDPVVDRLSDAAAPPAARQKFWQSRFFRLGAAAVLVVGAIQLAGGPALTALASL
ncbi:MAG: hypothetical protein ACK4HF_07770 [Paracoccaceae bacterium]